MSQNVSTLVAVATLGAGLVHLAVGAGAPLPLLILFAAAGVAELVWAVVVFRRGRVPAPRAYLATLLAPLAVWAAALALGAAADLPLGSLAAASALSLSAVVIVALRIRRERRGGAAAPVGAAGTDADVSSEHPWRFIGTLAASAAIVAGVVTPALAGTWAGQYAVPHGSHEVPGLVIDEHAGH